MIKGIALTGLSGVIGVWLGCLWGGLLEFLIFPRLDHSPCLLGGKSPSGLLTTEDLGGILEDEFTVGAFHG